MFALGQFHFTDHWKDPKMHQNRNTLLGNTELQNKKKKVIKRNSESLAQFKHLGELDSADHWRNQEMHLMHLFTILIWTIFQFCQISWSDLETFLCNECQLIYWNIMEPAQNLRPIHISYWINWSLLIQICMDNCMDEWIENDNDKLLVVNANMYG